MDVNPIKKFRWELMEIWEERKAFIPPMIPHDDYLEYYIRDIFKDDIQQ